MKLKKIAAMLLVTALGVSMLAGCGKKGETEVKEETKQEAEAVVDNSPETATIRIASMKGPTSMGLVSMYNAADNKTTENTYEYKIVGTADEITPNLLKGELDVACVPANLASVLFNKSEGKIQVLAINTLGVLYIVEKDGNTVTDMASLKGKTIYATGKGTTPEYALNYLLKANGLDPEKDVTIEWKSEAAEVVSTMVALEGNAIAMLPQPYVTVAGAQISTLRTAISLTEVWDSLNNGSQLVTGVVVARADFVKENHKAIDKMLADMSASCAYTSTNIDETAELIAQYGIVAKAPIAKKALPFCNIKFIEGTDMKKALSGYLQTLFDQNAQSVGGKLPDDSFYYISK